MKLTIPYQRLSLIPYHGAGNKTPVLDISGIQHIEDYSYEAVRSYLEEDKIFRSWLKKEGQKYCADSVMIYYHSGKEYVTFVGEPNASCESKFSDMCGNGIRCLVLHILLQVDTTKRKVLIKNGISIWAGDLKKITIIDFKPRLQQARIAVNMGEFQKESDKINSYINSRFFDKKDLSHGQLLFEKFPPFLRHRQFGIGLNSSNAIGEPHLVLLNTQEQFYQLAKECGFPMAFFDRETLMNTLVQVTGYLGTFFTFATDIFPQGINFNIGVVRKGRIFMATHERNIVTNKTQCLSEQKKKQICQCVTMACGTGGAVTANVARLQKYINTDNVITYHTGGSIKYILNRNDTIMIGPAEAIKEV